MKTLKTHINNLKINNNKTVTQNICKILKWVVIGIVGVILASIAGMVWIVIHCIIGGIKDGTSVAFRDIPRGPRY